MREFINVVDASKTDDFLRDFKNMSVLDPDDGGRVINGVTIYLSKSRSHPTSSIYVDDMKTSTTGKGLGEKALDAIITLADKHGVRIELLAKAFGEGGPNTPKLISWYSRRGFKTEWTGQQGCAWMVRTPCLAEEFAGGFRTTLGTVVEVFRNPSRREFDVLWTAHNAIRGFIGDDVFIWDAHVADHGMVGNKLGMGGVHVEWRDDGYLTVGWNNSWNGSYGYDDYEHVERMIKEHPAMQRLLTGFTVARA